MIDIYFTNADLELFSTVSHDINPLHMSDDYARHTPFGERVVFGILGALATLQYLPARPNTRLAKVALLFMNPIFVGVRYRLDITADGKQDRVQVFDGRKRILQATFTYRDMLPGEADLYGAILLADGKATASRQIAAAPSGAELVEGLSIEGRYMPLTVELEQFMRFWRLTEKGMAPADVIALIWTSYAVGMELPGKQAAYSRLEMTLFPLSADLSMPLIYQIKLAGKDPRFDLLQLKATLLAGDATIAEAQIWATMRAESPKSSLDSVTKILPESDQLRNRVALVIGGSRGLGAAFVQALALQGCTVLLNYARSHEEAAAIREELSDSAGRVHLFPGDAADGSWCEAQCRKIQDEYGGLDFLICNASPPIRPLDISTDTLDRFFPFVEKSLRLVVTPMAGFGELLRSRQGRYVVISSAYVQTTPVDFPHYVAAKCAIEGLLQAVCASRKPPYGVLVRPPKLLTDQTNTAVGKRDTMLPEQIAATVVARLLEDRTTDGLQIIDDFPGAGKG